MVSDRIVGTREHCNWVSGWCKRSGITILRQFPFESEPVYSLTIAALHTYYHTIWVFFPIWGRTCNWSKRSMLVKSKNRLSIGLKWCYYLGRNEWTTVEHSIKKAIFDLEIRKKARIEWSSDRLSHPPDSSLSTTQHVIQTPVTQWMINKELREWGLNLWRPLCRLSLTYASHKRIWSGDGLVWLSISPTGVELHSSKSSALNWFLMHWTETSKNVPEEVHYNGRILIWLSPTTQSANQKLWFGIPFHLITRSRIIVISVAFTTSWYVDDILCPLCCLSFHGTPVLYLRRIMTGCTLQSFLQTVVMVRDPSLAS